MKCGVRQLSANFLFLFLMLFVIETHSSERGLYFGGCTGSKNKILLCINNCDSDDITDWTDPSTFMFNQHQVVLDTETKTLHKIKDADQTIPCPHFDDVVIKQPYNELKVECLGNQTLLWSFEYQNRTQGNNTLSVELPSPVAVRYRAFYFITLKPKLKIHLLIQGNNKVRKGFILDESGVVLNSNWEFDIQESQEVLERHELVAVYLDGGRCEVIGQHNKKKYPVIYDGVGLAAFPEFQNTIWYYFNDTGFYPLAGAGILDKRREEIIVVRGSSVKFYSYASLNDFYEIDLTVQLEQFKVRRPAVVQPSVIIFTLSTLIIVGLIVAEVTTQRKKSGKCCQSGTEQGHRIIDETGDDEIELGEMTNDNSTRLRIKTENEGDC